MCDHINPPPLPAGLLVPPSDEDCSKDYREGKQQEDALHHSQIAPALKQQVRGGIVWDGMGWDGMGWDGMGWDGMGGCPRIRAISPVLSSCQVVDGKEQHGSAQSSATKNKVLVVRLNACDSISPEKVQFVCPLIRNSESLPPKREKAVMAEPQQGCVSTSRGSAYRPSLSDGSLTPAEVGVWERVPTPKEKNDLHMKLKLTSPDQKLTRPCRVHLVDVLTVQRSERALWDCDARGQTLKGLDGGRKDVRHHQGLHTGHRICCFSPCGNGIWRLKKVAAHAHTGGYVCSVCHKTFARRKVLRRHQRFHSGEKPYSCPACSKSFALRKSLRRHTRFHTGERPHVCTRCDKSFRLRENLKAHLRFHTGEKPFSCPTCGKMFRMVRNLEKHECPPAFVPSFRAIAGL